MTPKEARSSPAVDRSADSTGFPAANSRQTLRTRAEELAGERAGEMPENLEVLSPEVARAALHELRVHQIELEMQNEEPRRTQDEFGCKQLDVAGTTVSQTRSLRRRP